MTAPTGRPSGFDRLRSRVPAPRADRESPGAPRLDPQGRGALFSVSAQAPAPGAVTLTCSECGQTSAVSPRRFVALALPSVHLPLVRRGHPSWMRCPACRRRTWVKVVITL